MNGHMLGHKSWIDKKKVNCNERNGHDVRKCMNMCKQVVLPKLDHFICRRFLCNHPFWWFTWSTPKASGCPNQAGIMIFEDVAYPFLNFHIWLSWCHWKWKFGTFILCKFAVCGAVRKLWTWRWSWCQVCLVGYKCFFETLDTNQCEEIKQFCSAVGFSWNYFLQVVVSSLVHLVSYRLVLILVSTCVCFLTWFLILSWIFG